MKVRPVSIDWNPNLPIFASESFLREISADYGWLGGFDDSERLRCVLPYTIIKKNILRMVRFRVETISLDADVDINEERSFLNGVIDFFRSYGADIIIPGSNNAIFRTFPEGAIAAPYGSYVIDLSQSEETLWKNIQRIMRQNINSARKRGITIRNGNEELDAAYSLIRDTFGRSQVPFMDYTSFKKFVNALDENGVVLVADYQGIAQSYVVFAYSEYGAYAIYAGNLLKQQPGANKLLYWEAIRLFKSMGTKRFDFFGARINPAEGSKQAELSAFKKRFGAKLKTGFIWKYPLNSMKCLIYSIASYLRSGGDIVDAEHHKLNDSVKYEQGASI